MQHHQDKKNSDEKTDIQQYCDDHVCALSVCLTAHISQQ